MNQKVRFWTVMRGGDFMKMAHVELERTLEFDASGAILWCIESPRLFSKYLQELFFNAVVQKGNMYCLKKRLYCHWKRKVKLY